MKTQKKSRVKKVCLILAVVLVALCALTAVGGKFLFHFALDPNASISMNDLFGTDAVQMSKQSSTAAGLLADEAEVWEEYCGQAGEWFAREGRAVTLTREDGTARRGSFFRNESTHSYAIACHGYLGHSAQLAGYAYMYYEFGMSVLTPDALAHGESDGSYVGMGWLERNDILGWIDYLIELDPQAEILLFGVSMGGATVMMAAGEDLPDNVKCVVEDCGYTSVWDEFQAQLKATFHLPAFPLLYAADAMTSLKAGYSFREASALEQVKKATVPMLFIHGEADVFVPYEMQAELYRACGSAVKEKLSIPGAGHGQAASTDPVTYWTTIECFVGRFMSLNI